MAILYEQSLISRVQKNIASITLNQSNNCCLYPLESNDLVPIKLL